MRLHGNARTCPRSRRLLVERLERGWMLAQAAEAAGVSTRTAAKWRARWRCQGEAGLEDRSSLRCECRGAPPKTVSARSSSCGGCG
jgi:transposase